MAKFAKIIHENNENLLIKKFIEHFKHQASKIRKKKVNFCAYRGGYPYKSL